MAHRITELLNASSLATALAFGHKVGLLDAMASFDGKPFSVQQLAERAGTSARYTQEWLSVLLTGKIVETAGPSDQPLQVVFPAELAQVLSSRGGSGNMAPYLTEVPLLSAAVHSVLPDCMRTGHGIAYAQYGAEFFDLMEQFGADKHRRTLVQVFLQQGFPAMHERLAAAADGDHRVRVLDIGCSAGTAVLLLAQAFPQAEFVGVDLDAGSIAQATRAAAAQALSNVRFVQCDLTMPADQLLQLLPGTFHWITAFDVIHDLTRPLDVLRAVHRMLHPDGAFSMVDIKAKSDVRDNVAHPFAPFLYTVSMMHCLAVGLRDGGRGLGMMWGEETATALLQEAGFSRVSVHTPPEDAFNVEYRAFK
eukprot:m.130466 g.130466  ORF g.130466 m.130466 type:complete len:364 (+) comp19982_c0_seq1:23-1114(+)